MQRLNLHIESTDWSSSKGFDTNGGAQCIVE